MFEENGCLTVYNLICLCTCVHQISIVHIDSYGHVQMFYVHTNDILALRR